MSSLSDELTRSHGQIVQRWYEEWARSAHPHPEVGEAALKDLLGVQLQFIGEQLRDLATAERPQDMWKVVERLDPELRVPQNIPIEEVVQEYGLAVRVVRDWIEEHHLDVPFGENSYFSAAMFELTAEAARRYAKHQAALLAQARATYVAGVMHQLRTPISALASRVEFLARSGAPLDARSAGMLRRNVERISSLVESMLRVERYAPEDVPVRPREVQPAHVIREIMDDLEEDASSKALRLEAHVSRSLRMRTDPDLFLDALSNLIHNAVKFTATGFVIVEVEEGDRDVLFWVRDSGPGVPEEKRRTLFTGIQPGAAGGAGLGLRVAQQAAFAQGGAITLETDGMGIGATFCLRLPRDVALRQVPEAKPVGRGVPAEGAHPP
jgi:signal transduction histidine kinase